MGQSLYLAIVPNRTFSHFVGNFVEWKPQSPSILDKVCDKVIDEGCDEGQGLWFWDRL